MIVRQFTANAENKINDDNGILYNWLKVCLGWFWCLLFLTDCRKSKGFVEREM